MRIEGEEKSKIANIQKLMIQRSKSEKIKVINIMKKKRDQAEVKREGIKGKAILKTEK